MDERHDVEGLVSGLVAESESARKYAVFKLQSLLADPDYADAFIEAEGLSPLRNAVLSTNGNAQAYAFGSLDALLELDRGWNAVDGVVIEKAVQLATTHPLVNIVRNAITMLVLIVSRPLTSKSGRESVSLFGFRAIKSALDQYPDFLDSLMQRLSASDHTLCANALQLVNALMRDAVVNGGEYEWPKFIKRLQDLGVIGAVGMLMRGDAAMDIGSPLAAAIYEFQGLTRMLLRKWKEVRVNLEQAEHKRSLKTIHLLSKPDPYQPIETNGDSTDRKGGRSGRKHHPEKWRRLGFETESPAWEFDETGYLGVMYLDDFARRNEGTYTKILMEQAVQPKAQRCPIARASISVTLILYEHFEIDVSEDLAASDLYRNGSVAERLAKTGVDSIYRPLLLQWGRLHTASLNTFLRLWKLAGAELDDFYKIEELIRIIVEKVVGSATRKTDVGTVEEELRNVSLAQARTWQMDGFDEIYQDGWGPHLIQVREQLHHESMQFMKEQRIRCLLKGSWFPTSSEARSTWRFVRLHHNRRWLHYRTYPSQKEVDPSIDELPDRIDMNTVTSVDSNVTKSEHELRNDSHTRTSTHLGVNRSANDSAETLKMSTKDEQRAPMPAPGVGDATTTKLTIMGTPPRTHTLSHFPPSSPDGRTSPEEKVLLELFPKTSYLASEWLDGLLMVLNQQPITKDTTRLIDLMEDWGVRLRLLNLRWDDVDWEALELGAQRGQRDTENGNDTMTSFGKEVPSREGLKGEEYWYAMPET